MWGENKMPINDVCIRTCDAFGQLSHPSPRKVEPDRVHRTAGAVGQDELRFQIGNI
jgi:lipoate synthase